MHAHLPGARDLSYPVLFKDFSAIPPEKRNAEKNDMIIAFPVVQVRGEYLYIIAFEGPVGVNPTIFNIVDGSIRTEQLERGEIIARKTHALVDARRRRLAIEYVRRGAKSFDLAIAIRDILAASEARYRRLDLEFTPIVDEDFLKQINEFERIREAELTVTRPNASWSDHYTQLSELLEESGGEKGDIGIRARRGGSIRKNKGIIQVIRDVIKDRFPYLKSAMITGRRKGEDADTTLRTTKHIAHTRGIVDLDDNEDTLDGQAFEHLRGLLRQDPSSQG
jgi:hypothetical protein